MARVFRAGRQCCGGERACARAQTRVHLTLDRAAGEADVVVEAGKHHEWARAADLKTATRSFASRHDRLSRLGFSLEHPINVEHEPLGVGGDDDVSVRRVDLHQGAGEDNVGEFVGLSVSERGTVAGRSACGVSRANAPNVTTAPSRVMFTTAAIRDLTTPSWTTQTDYKFPG